MDISEINGSATAQKRPGHDIGSVLQQALQQAPAPIVLTDNHGVIVRVNAAFERATGYAASELRGQRPSMLKSGLQGDGFYRSMWAELAQLGHWQGEIWNRHKDGRTFQECLSIVALRHLDGTVSHYLGMYSGLASPMQARKKMVEHGETDSTTGLLNRCAFVCALQRLCDQRGLVHVLALDIDGFTDFNEQFGLVGGDAVLRQMALRCTQVGAASGGSCIVGRVGPDEFALGLVGPSRQEADKDWIQQVAAQLSAAVALPCELDGARKAAVTASIGLASLALGQGTAAEALLHASSARQQGDGCSPALQRYETHDGQRRLAHALHEAIRLDQIDVAYQPKVELSSGRLAGVEALARWTLADGSSVPPSEFIPLAERRGLVGLLGDRVLERAVGQLARWRSQGLDLPAVAINFSALQFHRDNPARQVAQSLARHAVPAHLLELELTESLLIGEMDTVMQSLKDLRALGIALSIDDFGTGYSSLAYLRRFPIQYLKIDRQFVADMADDPGAYEVVKMIVTLAHRLGLRCIAEGIETLEQLVQLRAMGCDEGQGFLLARPMNAEALAQLLAGTLPWQALLADVTANSPACSDADQYACGQSCAYWEHPAAIGAGINTENSRLENIAVSNRAELVHAPWTVPPAHATSPVATSRAEGGMCPTS
ncbi:MAG TPA: EAL domain-containing protein [Burkholderiaceae bacterium]|nr:EAL domain-containing protein [Burkholderiaceae bacterium]